MKNILYKSLFLGAVLSLFAACDKDFNEIGADIIGDDHFDMELYSDAIVTAYDRKIDSVQSNNLPINALGIFDNPIFGKTTANFVTQVELINANPTFDANPVVLKAELTVPYFSHRDDFDSETGATTYVLDSIWGSGKIDLKVYESNYFLRDYDPETGFTQLQKYYSHQGNMFDSNHGANILNDDPSPSQNTEFGFDPSEVVVYETNDEGEQVVADRLTPRMTLSLNKQFFQDKIFGPAAQGQLINNNQFKQYFKGLYFKVGHAASNPTGGSLALMDFKQGKITITYEVDGDNNTRVEKTYVLNLTGNTVNTYENEPDPAFVNAATSTDQINGDEKLFIKGGAGSVAVINLFGPDDQDPLEGDDVPEQLEQLRLNGWQVNDASLTFFVDASSMANSSKEPDRIMLYDIDNKRPLIDYYTDVTTTGNPKYSKYLHDGLIQRVPVSPTESRGFKYRIRLTNHIRNLLDPEIDSTNVRLGLVVTENIGNVSMAKLASGNHPILNNIVPVSSVTNQLGTILYGTNPIVPADKRLKLEIYYTKERNQ